jgi:hypothetical protein
MSTPSSTAYCLEIHADADPVVLIRLVERIQSLGLILRQLVMDWTDDERTSIRFVFSGVDADHVDVLARRVAQFTTVHTVFWSEVSGAGGPLACDSP